MEWPRRRHSLTTCITGRPSGLINHTSEEQMNSDGGISTGHIGGPLPRFRARSFSLSLSVCVCRRSHPGLSCAPPAPHLAAGCPPPSPARRQKVLNCNFGSLFSFVIEGRIEASNLLSGTGECEKNKATLCQSSAGRMFSSPALKLRIEFTGSLANWPIF